MGWQTAIAKAIRDGGGHYFRHVKDNHPTFRRQVDGFFQDAHREDRPKDQPTAVLAEKVVTDGGHGRVEVRRCESSTDLSWVDDRASWPDLARIIRVSRRGELAAGGAATKEHDVYIASEATLTAEKAEPLARNHCAIAMDAPHIAAVRQTLDHRRDAGLLAPWICPLIRAFATWSCACPRSKLFLSELEDAEPSRLLDGLSSPLRGAECGSRSP